MVEMVAAVEPPHDEQFDRRADQRSRRQRQRYCQQEGACRLG